MRAKINGSCMEVVTNGQFWIFLESRTKRNYQRKKLKTKPSKDQTYIKFKVSKNENGIAGNIK